MGAGILLTLILLFASQLSFAGSTASKGTLGVCAVEIPVAKKWHGEDSFLFF